MRKLVEKQTIYTLNCCYKDNDSEVLGAFDSVDALLAFFGKFISQDHREDPVEDTACLIATLTANLLGEGDDDECVDGRTRYWYEEFKVMGFEEEEVEE